MMAEGCGRVAATPTDRRLDAVDLKVEPVGADANTWV